MRQEVNETNQTESGDDFIQKLLRTKAMVHPLPIFSFLLGV